MLQNIRDNAQGTVAKIIVGLIVFTFALFGVDSIIGSLGGKPKVAVVNGVDITQKQFNSEFERTRRQIINQMGPNADASQINENLLKKTVLQRMISQSLLKQAATKQGFYVSDAFADQLIISTPQFQLNGRFDNNRFLSLVNRLGMTTNQLREDIVNNVIISQVKNGIISSEFAFKNEAKKLISLDRQTRSIGLIRFTRNKFMPKVKISNTAVSQYWQAHQANYTAPDEVNVSYILLDKTALEKSINVDKDKLDKLYQQEVNNFTAKESRQAAHILIKVSDKVSKKEALKEIDNIQAKLKAGASFASMAKKYSQDLGSASSGGDLGYIGKNMLGKKFEATLYSLKKGQVSQPVLTKYGYHLIKLLNIRRNSVPSLAEASPLLERSYRESQAEKRYVDMSEKLSNISYTTANLKGPSEELKLPIQKALNVLKKGEEREIFKNRQVQKALFSNALRSGDGNSDLINLSRNKSIVLHVDKFIPARPLTLKESKAKILTKLKGADATRLAVSAGDKVLQLYSVSGNANKGKASTTISWAIKKDLKRNQTGMSPDLIGKIFSMPYDKANFKPVYRGFKQADGSFVVVRLDAVKQVGLSKLNSVEIKSTQKVIASNSGEIYYEYYRKYLKSHAKITKP